jgi:CRP/FNR family transcriptional regulator, cyclic AMP receptor protein
VFGKCWTFTGLRAYQAPIRSCKGSATHSFSNPSALLLLRIGSGQKCAVSVNDEPIISLASSRMTSLKHVLSGDVMQAIARSSNINSKRKSTQKRAFDAQAFLDSAGVARRVVEYRRSQKAYSQGDPATSVMYLQKGGVKLSVVNETGKEAVVAILGPGDFLGEGCLAGQSICMATATTIGPTAVLVIEKDEMIRTLHEEHEFSDRFIAYMLARNIRVEEDLIDQLFNSSEKRLARTLLLLARYGAQGHPQKVLPKVSQEMLAEMIGTTRGRVNFFMNKFRKLGFIQYNGEIHINNSLLSVVLHE